MPSPITWQALQAIESELSVIRIANGFATDLGASVVLEHEQSMDDDVPRLALGMDSLSVRDLTSNMREHAFIVIVECLVPASRIDAQQRIHEAIDDVLRVFPSSARSLTLSPSGQLASINADTAQVLPRPEGTGMGVAQVRLTARIRSIT